jgi:hypothetical protein
MWKKILLAIAVVIVILLIVVALQPADFRVTRTATMAVQPAQVFEQVNDFHNWSAWSPWEKIDPDMTRTYDGPTSGKGAVYSWSGNGDVGEGSMKITESRPNELVQIDLEFIKPFAGSNNIDFTLKPEGYGTTVVWDMTGKKNFMSKAICMFVSMDKMVGGQFEQGLANLKSVVEPKPPTSDDPQNHSTDVK